MNRLIGGRTFPEFRVVLPELLWTFDPAALGPKRDVDVGRRPPQRPLPLYWPIVIVLRGSACHLALWDELKVDPRSVWLCSEVCEYFAPVQRGEEVRGQEVVRNVSEHEHPTRGIEQQVNVEAELSSATRRPLARYTCSYRFPVCGHKP
jgi:hypothetical protein